MTARVDETLWDSIVRRATTQRERTKRGRSTVRRADLPVEVTPFGRLRWYLHHELKEQASQALYLCELEIPEASRSGRIRHQGGIVCLVVEGSGYTNLDGVDHAWEKRDVIGLPVRPKGVVFQHVNNGVGPVRMIIAWPNLDSAIGPEGGVHLEVVEPAPEYGATT